MNKDLLYSEEEQKKIIAKSIDKTKCGWYYVINPKEIRNKQKGLLTRKGILKIEYHIFYKMYFYYKFSIRLRIEKYRI